MYATRYSYLLALFVALGMISLRLTSLTDPSLVSKLTVNQAPSHMASAIQSSARSLAYPASTPTLPWIRTLNPQRAVSLAPRQACLLAAEPSVLFVRTGLQIASAAYARFRSALPSVPFPEQFKQVRLTLPCSSWADSCLELALD
jgi:hypothetical protein